ncbi:hemerythrin domain-containing protein [Pseudomonas sp. 5P_3.1_Bac2]|uniref:hemerythrin domain-containing protein n=1 Tax=Pseudomonas sp. 5P_3.1_Bac2 TaxID=2971617 RepID=UPI0021C570E0|nr:hemerythrin domain-containing protein [Pseudomonas sp. 5P_3.1_Bac2]MCU1715553.1 hemerythrin domain-containing protein [Pseudomonas sp. 5P_3.1_Bac2]
MASIGSKPVTKFRGDPAIFGTLVEDHDHHRQLLAQIEQTHGASTERKQLFAELTAEIKGHAAAEEQALWSTVLRKPEITEDGRHAVAEHKEMDDLLEELAATDMATGGWLLKFKKVKEEYLHHIKEEEQELFVSVEKKLSKDDKSYMDSIFKQRKGAEKAKARKAS